MRMVPCLVGSLALALATGLAGAQNGLIAPEQAAKLASSVRPGEEIAGTFVLTVRRTARVKGKLLLDSNQDYRSAQNLTIEIEPTVLDDLTSHYGQPADNFFLDKTITVDGKVKRVRIDFVSSPGVPTGKYYFQTHVVVRDWKQIHLAIQTP